MRPVRVPAALRAATRRPANSILLTAIMATAIASTTAVFSVLDSVLLRPMPFRDPKEIVELWTREPDGSAYPRLDREVAEVWTSQSPLFTGVERYVDKSMLLSGVDEPEELRAVYISQGLLPLLGVAPERGRAFTADDMRGDAPEVALVSGDFYRRHVASFSPGKPTMVRLDDKPVQVVGVMPDWFRYPRGIVGVWLPLRDSAVARGQQFNYVARLRPGITEPVARARFDDYARRLAATTPRKDGWGVSPIFVAAAPIAQNVRVGLFVLAGAVVCVMLVACVNAANLLLAQATVRQREFGIRAALGATRGNLVAQLLAESFVLAAAGALIGILVSYWAVDMVLLILPRELSIFGNATVAIDTRVLAFSIAASFVTWILCSVGPAWHASRARGTLVTGDRSNTSSRRMRRVRGGLAIAELALSLVLVCGAGLFMRSLANLTAVEPGFDIAHVAGVALGISLARYPTPAQRSAYLDALQGEIQSVPGVRSVTVASGLPPQTGITFGRPEIEDGPILGRGEMTIPFADVDTGFFSTLGIPLLNGRAFTRDDLDEGNVNRVISAKLAAALWPGQNPIGRRFRLDPKRPWSTVVGVAGDVKLNGPDDHDTPFQIYYPRSRMGRSTRSVSLAMRTDRDPKLVLAAVKRAIRKVNPDQPITRLGAAADLFAEATAKARFTLVLMSVFAAMALSLAIAGTYSVLSYSVAQRRREIGIRMALGAEPTDVVRAFVRDGLLLAAAGVLLGLAGVALASRVAQSLLFGVTPHDPLVLFSMSSLLIGVALLATLVPALRASRVSPMIAITPE